MKVARYIPGRFYGFCSTDDGNPVFFHINVFKPGGHHQPPPIQGEEVDVVIGVPAVTGRAPKAISVCRVHPAKERHGRVDRFNQENGWGFIIGEDGESYYLHRSEVLDGKLPLPGKDVCFYASDGGSDRVRACYVRVLTSRR